jgi:hypothetical protein
MRQPSLVAEAVDSEIGMLLQVACDSIYLGWKLTTSPQRSP